MAINPVSRQLAAKTARPINTRKILRMTLLYLLLVFISFIIVFPLLWMLATSFKPKNELFTREIQWLPKNFTFDNYTAILNSSSTPIVTWFGNSILVSTITTILVLLIDSLAAYAFARLNFPGRKPIFALLLVTLFLPSMMFLIPNFLTIYQLGLLNTFAGVILPALSGVFGVFFLRQFFESIPKELEEAAEIDGASIFQRFFRVVLPLAKPALATLGIITFLHQWNEFLWPLLVLKDRELQTLPLGLRTLQGAMTSEYGIMMAGAVIVAIPVLILYIVLQRFIVASVATTGIKG